MGLLFGTPVDVDGWHVDPLTASKTYCPIGTTSHMTYRQDGRDTRPSCQCSLLGRWPSTGSRRSTIAPGSPW
jgi:hypothetical protein